MQWQYFLFVFSLICKGYAGVVNPNPSTSTPSTSSQKRLVGYYGQNAAGQANSQKSLSEYCSTSTYDIIVLAFLINFNVGGNPTLNFANACEQTFPGTTLLNCPNIAKGITDCQKAGKIVLLSLGGATGGYVLNSPAEATTFAKTLWQMFGPVSKAYSGLRPFGSASVDGFDLDIESGVNAANYIPLVNTLRDFYATDSAHKYYISTAPQCFRPDASLDATLKGAHVDFVFIQFYNNYCGLTKWRKGAVTDFNFADWNSDLANFKNKQAQLFIGAPGSPASAGSGYVPASTLVDIIKDVSAKFASFAGVMLWDISTSADAPQIKSALSALSGSTPSKSTSVSVASQTSKTQTSTLSITKTITASASITSNTSPTLVATTIVTKTVTQTVNPQPTFPVSTDGTCGPEVMKACAAGYCCSQYGYCGASEAYCRAGCQNKYGFCFS